MADDQKGPPKAIIKAISKLNVWLYRLTGGRVGGKLAGAPVCLVTMTGRKSGREITIPLMYVPHGDDVILVASLGGAPKHPVWYHNLMANPAISIEAEGKTRAMTVRQANPDEKKALWPVAVASYPEFDAYQKRTDRDIPVLICSPAAAA